MNIITDKLPDSIGFKGEEYPIKTDFKVWLRFYEIMTDKEKSPAEKFTDAVLCSFDSEKCKRLPDSLEETIAFLFDFFWGMPAEQDGEKYSEKVFDFSEDSKYIFASFFQEYGIDLTECDMHWYKFLVLLSGLSETSQLKKIIAWRSVDLSEIKDPKRRSFCLKMKHIYRLKGNGSSAMTERNIAEELSKAF